MPTLEEQQAAYVAEMRAPFVCRGPRDDTGNFTSVTLPTVGYYRSDLTLSLARCVRNNTQHVCYDDAGHRLEPGRMYLIYGTGPVDEVTDGLGNYKRERSKRVEDNRRNGRWVPGRKLHDGPERIFEE